jgi:serine O-acetyltransferase
MSLDAVHAALLASYENDGGINHLDGVNLPAQESVNTLARDYMHLLFPGYFEATALEKNAVSAHVHRLLSHLEQRLTAELEKCLRFARQPEAAARAATLAAEALGRFPQLRRIIQTDVTAAYQGDPAARSDDVVERHILARTRRAHAVTFCAAPVAGAAAFAASSAFRSRST